MPWNEVYVVEDDEGVARAILREMPRVMKARLFKSVEEARHALAAAIEPPRAAIVDIGLPDGTGLDVVAAIRRRRPSTPVLVLTASRDPDVINRCHELRAEFVCKPRFRRNLIEFLKRVPVAVADGGNTADGVAALAREFSLTPREAEIVARAAGGVPRRYLLDELGVTENTLKSQIRSILDKTGCSSLPEVVWKVRSR